MKKVIRMCSKPISIFWQVYIYQTSTLCDIKAIKAISDDHMRYIYSLC